MTEGLVSIITATFNSGEYIGRTIESVLAQTYQNWEMVITDDCSTDNTASIVESYSARDSRIRLLRLTKNGGPGVSRNNSLINSNGRYIAFLDSDDFWLPDKLECQLELMKSKNCRMVYSSYYTCDENNRITGLVDCGKRVSYLRMICNGPIGFLTFMYDRKGLEDVLLPEIRKRQDWGFKICLMKSCRMAYGLSEPKAIYKIRQNSVSRNKLTLAKYNIAVYRTILGMSGFAATAMFIFAFIPTFVCRKTVNFIKTFPFRLSCRRNGITIS